MSYTETKVVYFQIEEAYRRISDIIQTFQKGKSDIEVSVIDRKEPSRLKAKIPYGALDISVEAQDGKSLLQFNLSNL